MKIWDPLYSIEEADKIIVGFGPEADRIRHYFNKTFTYCPIHKKDLFDMKIIDIDNILFPDLKEQFEKNPKAQWIFLGGNHAITPRITKRIKPKTLLSLDAHLDLLEESRYKNPHARAMLDVHKQGIDVAIRGYRTCAMEELYYADTHKLDTAHNLEFNKQVDYLSIDLDVLDPIYVETSTPEAFGFTPLDVCEVIKKTKPQFADIVEWKPNYGYAQVAAIFKELLFL